MGLGQGVVAHVGVKVLAALRTAVLGVNQMNVTRPTDEQVPEIVQDASETVVATAALPTPRATPMREVATAQDDLRGG